MNVTRFFAFAVFLLVVRSSGQTALEEAIRLEMQGQFKQSATVLSNGLAEASNSRATRNQLEFELERLARIRKDFTLTRESLYQALTKSVRDLTWEEFQQWVTDGRFDSREIDGELRFMRSSASNLYFHFPELESRRIQPKGRGAREKVLLSVCAEIKKAALTQGKSYVSPKRFQVVMNVTVKTDAVPDGKRVSAWLPIPRQYPFQTDFEMLSAAPKSVSLNSPESSIRAAYFEQPARAGKPTRFNIEYEYTAHAVKFDIKPDEVRPCNAHDPQLAPFLCEAPHVKFTPAMRALSAEIVGDETNSFFKAKKFYEWIAHNIKYSFAVEYSTQRNISEYCRARGYGDCGQEALLFITLCRLNGIPARWQSGWNTFPGNLNIHDWSEIYLAPYGWMPVDPYMAIWATQYTRTLDAEQKREVRDFYFGGLDQWRMIANSDHSQELSPSKKSFRSDDVDFQRGELEWAGHNLYFDKFTYDLSVKEVKLPR